MKMNKRGDKILSVYWFAVIIIVAGGIFAMVYVYYGTPYDVREIEANVLTNQIADCVSYAGRINANLISNTQESGVVFLKQCHLNFDSTEWTDKQYYAEVNLYKLNDLNNPTFSVNAGDNKWLSFCSIQENNPQERLTKCVRKSFYSLDSSNNQYIIKILTVVRKAEKNVKI